jgi:outer membrane protein assembly factor BamB
MLLADPAHHGVQPGPAPEGTPRVRWSVHLPDGSKSSPQLVGGLLLVGGLDHTLRALDPTTGEERWRHTAEGELGRGGAAADGLVFWVDSTGTLSAIDIATGEPRWTRAVNASRETAPTAVDGVVYVGTETGALGLDAATGEEHWRFPTTGAVRTVTVADGQAIFGAEDRQIRAVSLTDDRELWRVLALNGSIGPALLEPTTVYIAALQPFGEPSSELYALDRTTGDVRWRFRIPSGLSVSPLAFRDGRLYVSTQDDGLQALRADDGVLLWRAGEVGQVLHGVALVDDQLIAATVDGELVSIDAVTGEVSWRLPVAQETRTQPVVSGGSIFLAQEDGTVTAYDAIGAAATASPEPSAASSEVPSAGELVSSVDAAGVPGLGYPYGMDLAPDGALVVANGRTDQILVIRPDGTLERRFGGHGTAEGKLSFQRQGQDPLGGVAVGPDGTIYVADSANFRVQAFTREGEFLRGWGSYGRGDGQFLDPVDLDVGPDGSVYVVDDVRDQIQRFSPDGAWIQTIGSHGSGDGQMNFTGSISVAPDGTLVNADWSNNRVQAWDADGTFLWTLGSGGTGPGQFRSPADVAVDADGNLWVADEHRVQVFDSADRRLIATWEEPGGTSDDQLGTIVLTDDGHAWVSRPWGHRLLRLQLAPLGE